jgi:uncharacterized protein (TIGR00299 family) protein
MSSPSLPDGARLSIHLDLVGGVAGDMFVAAMVDALPALEAPIRRELEAVRPGNGAMPDFTVASSAGLRARRFGIAATSRYRAVEAGDGTSYRELRRTIEAAPLGAGTQRHALALLDLLAAAEARVHGSSLDDVHFHELADWDSLMDVVAAGCIAHRLDGARWTASALPLGGGRVRTEHGMLPIPAPATSSLLEGYPWRDDGVPGERVTPTGAAIVRHLVPASSCGGRSGAGRLMAVGAGAGTRTLPGLPNILRVLVFESERPARDFDADADFVGVIEFDVDDMTGEEIALATDRLRALAGVLDVSIGARFGKKGRPLSDFRVLAQPSAVASVAHACFSETSTLGLRVHEDRRQVLRRTEVRADAVSVKVAQRPGGARTGKAAHDDVAADATLEARRKAGATAVERALKEDEG